MAWTILDQLACRRRAPEEVVGFFDWSRGFRFNAAGPDGPQRGISGAKRDDHMVEQRITSCVLGFHQNSGNQQDACCVVRLSSRRCCKRKISSDSLLSLLFRPPSLIQRLFSTVHSKHF